MHYSAPPRGNIPDGIKELTLQTVNIPTGGSQQETCAGGGGWVHVHGVVEPLIGDLSLDLPAWLEGKKAKGPKREELDERASGAGRDTLLFV